MTCKKIFWESGRLHPVNNDSNFFGNWIRISGYVLGINGSCFPAICSPVTKFSLVTMVAGGSICAHCQSIEHRLIHVGFADRLRAFPFLFRLGDDRGAGAGMFLQRLLLLWLWLFLLVLLWLWYLGAAADYKATNAAPRRCCWLSSFAQWAWNVGRRAGWLWGLPAAISILSAVILADDDVTKIWSWNESDWSIVWKTLRVRKTKKKKKLTIWDFVSTIPIRMRIRIFHLDGKIKFRTISVNVRISTESAMWKWRKEAAAEPNESAEERESGGRDPTLSVFNTEGRASASKALLSLFLSLCLAIPHAPIASKQTHTHSLLLLLL